MSHPKSQNPSEEEFDGNLSKDDMVHVMKHSNQTHTLKKQVVYDLSHYLHEVKPSDIINTVDNYSGTRLMAEIRKKCPGVLPSVKEERLAKKRSQQEFQAVLLPSRTATGWSIDLDSLLILLTYKYGFLQGSLCVRMWGDAQDIGGRHARVLCVTIIKPLCHILRVILGIIWKQT